MIVCWRKDLADSVVILVRRKIGERIIVNVDAALRPRAHGPKRASEEEQVEDIDVSGYGGAHSVQGLRGGESKSESQYQSEVDDRGKER